VVRPAHRHWRSSLGRAGCAVDTSLRRVALYKHAIGWSGGRSNYATVQNARRPRPLRFAAL
jgi:hypothetical protein